ncbi:hypothetical protein AWB70_04226 [Caballeronia cordobensis]|uniref:Uncharacterized protein n=1 Tax=Caballeronia cordobensis TaxID=1353886 RepID=A0A158I5B0_CABCO|nr:hypothetical protein AWB70_04226 [Caballeronia cordobensis]
MTAKHRWTEGYFKRRIGTTTGISSHDAVRCKTGKIDVHIRDYVDVNDTVDAYTPCGRQDTLRNIL